MVIGSGGFHAVAFLNSCPSCKRLTFEQDLRNATAWNPPVPITNLVVPGPDDLIELIVSSWQLGITEKHNAKGKSKMVYIMDTVRIS